MSKKRNDILTPEESLDSLREFFLADMWFAKGAEWKTEKAMAKYINVHFDICKDEIMEYRYGKVNKRKSSQLLQIRR